MQQRLTAKYRNPLATGLRWLYLSRIPFEETLSLSPLEGLMHPPYLEDEQAVQAMNDTP